MAWWPRPTGRHPEPRGLPPDERVPDYIGSDTFSIAGVETSDADYHHAVVMRGSKLYWDPEGAVTLPVTSVRSPDEDR